MEIYFGREVRVNGINVLREVPRQKGRSSCTESDYEKWQAGYERQVPCVWNGNV